MRNGRVGKSGWVVATETTDAYAILPSIHLDGNYLTRCGAAQFPYPISMDVLILPTVRNMSLIGAIGLFCDAASQRTSEGAIDGPVTAAFLEH